MNDKISRILIVDDEPNNLQLLKQILQDHYYLSFATNGAKALELVQKIRMDLILLDIMMPGIDGFEVCRQLKLSPETKEIPVIFLTAKRETDDIVLGFNLGAVDYVTKPFRREELMMRVKTHLKLKQTEEDLRLALIDAETAKESAELALQQNLLMQKQISKDLAAGAAMQKKFLTGQQKAEELLNATGYKLVVYNKPYATVSGDFFYPIHITETCVGFFFADACGHGLPAALISLRILGMLQSLTVSDYSPKAYLTAVNQDICDVMPHGRFIAASFLIFHPGRVVISNGGQPFPVLVSDENVTEINVSGTPVGILPSAQFSDMEVKININDRLILYSDGITEAKNERREHLNKERLLSYLLNHVSLDADHLKEGIVNMLDEFKGQTPSDDDMTIIIIERNS